MTETDYSESLIAARSLLKLVSAQLADKDYIRAEHSLWAAMQHLGLLPKQIEELAQPH